ncbi:MAG: nuclear transport factor 2 family protein [Chloroflexota bacterium]|nr:nuclear transport factor 2 family protein [Chloroflexota bacterium]
MTGDEQALIQLQNDWMDAWRRADTGRIEEILAPEFTLTSARTDQIVNRSEWLRMLADVRNESFAYSDFRIDVLGDAAVVRSRMTQVATVGDQRWDGRFVLTDVWIRRAGRWQVVARHSSMPPAKAFVD